MVERDLTAVGDHAVDERDVGRRGDENALVPAVELGEVRGRKLAIRRSMTLSRYSATTPSRHPVAPKYFENE